MVNLLSFPVIAVAVIVMVWLTSCIRVVKEDQRILVFRLGSQLGYRGPGLVFLFKPFDDSQSIAIGEKGFLVTEDTASFRGITFPVKVESSAVPNQSVIIMSFEPNYAIVALDASERESFTCQFCGNVNYIQK